MPKSRLAVERKMLCYSKNHAHATPCFSYFHCTFLFFFYSYLLFCYCPFFKLLFCYIVFTPFSYSKQYFNYTSITATSQYLSFCIHFTFNLSAAHKNPSHSFLPSMTHIHCTPTSWLSYLPTLYLTHAKMAHKIPSVVERILV